MKLLSLLFVLLIIGCSDTKTSTPKTASNPIIDRSKMARISLRRTGCYGTCPMYSVVVWSDGFVVYEGREYVGKEGVREVNISSDKFNEIMKDVQLINFFSLNNQYEGKSCGGDTSDLPSAIIEIRDGKRQKAIRFVPFCRESPEAIHLEAVAARIDLNTGAGKWAKPTSEQLKAFTMYNQE